MPDDGFSLKLKHAARNKTDINLAVVNGLYFPSLLHKRVPYVHSSKFAKKKKTD
jgi:hypothetical protein